MTELNIGELTGSTSYTGSVDTTNIFDLYKFNINSPGSFQLSIDGLSGNADIFLLNNSGATLYSSTNAGTNAETITADSLVAGEYSVKVLQITGDIKYTLNLAPTSTQKASDADTLIGAKSDSLLPSNSATTSEKPTANKDVITGTPVEDKTVTAEATSTTTEKPVTDASETTLTSEPKKTVAATEYASEKLSSEETKSPLDKPTDSVISTAEQPSETAAINNPSSTATAKTDAVAGETVATQEPKTGETLVAISPDATKSGDETNTDTSNGEETEKENTTTTVATTETKKEPEPTTDKKLISPFTSGIFTTDKNGRISVDYTFDGGKFQGELAIFSLDDLEKFEPGSEAFIKEVAARSLSNSVKGHVVIDDATEGARFSGLLGEINANEGVYLGVKSFAVTPGGKYGVMLVPNGSVKFVYDNPTVGGDQRPLFSMAMANPVEGFHFGQIADLTGEGNTFIMEDMRLDAGSDRDYNDIIFQVRGATATTALVDSVINPDKEWRETDLGQALIAYAKPYITPETKPNVDAELSDLLDDLETEILNPSTSDKETPKTPAPATNTDKDTTEATQVETTNQVDAKPTTPAVTTEEEVKDTANNSGDSTQVETTDQVDAKPTTGATTTPTADKDTAADSAEQLPVEKTPVPAATTEAKDEVTEAPATATVPAQSTFETEVAATTSTEKVETQPEVLPAESLTKVETEPEVLLAKNPAEEESKPALVSEVEKTETTKVVVATNPVESVKESQPTAAVESKETTEVKPSLPVKQTDLESMPVTTANKSEESQMKEIVSETPAISEVVIPEESLPSLPIVDESTEDDSATVKNPQPSIDVFPTGSEVDYSISANLIARLESLKQSLTNLGSADDPGGNISNETLISRLESVTQKLITFNESATVSDNIVALVDRLEETVDRLTILPIQPPLPSIETAQFDFPAADQPIIGVIDTGFAGNNSDIDYSRINWGQDRVDGDADPRLEPGKGNEHGTHVLGIIAATQNNGVGIDGINQKAPIWAGRAIGSGKWADSLVEYVDFVKAAEKKNAVINLSMDLTQVNPDGTTTTRYELTPQERSAIEYARQNGVMMVVAAGNDGGVMSALGQASQEFDNIITVGSADRVNDEIALSKAYDRTNYSSYGQGLDIVAPGGTLDNPQLSTVGDGVGFMAGTSTATAKVTGAASQVWAANPALSFRQVIEILKQTATDLKTTDWDSETGAGLLNIEASVALALATTGEKYATPVIEFIGGWSGEGEVTPTERASANPFWPTVEPTNFSASVMATIGANVRSGPGTNFAIVGSYPYQSTIQFNGWTYGERINDLQLGTPDERWYRIAGTNNWIASAIVNGNAPGSTPLPLPTPTPTPTPTLPFDINKLLAIPPSSIRTFASDSIPRILAEALANGITDLGQIAYILATAQHESLLGRWMEELASGDAYEGRQDLGNTQPGDGRRFKGRGYVQITGRSNYAKWSQRLGIDLINNPGLASDPAIAAKILVLGMRDGSFTGVGLSNYFNSSKRDFFNARRIVNGVDKASSIAQIAERYLNALRSASTSPTPTPTNSGQAPITGYREYSVKKGDFPSTIALRELGNANRWREILKADNTPLTDFDATRLQMGQKLLLPVSYQSGSGTPVTQTPANNPTPVSSSNQNPVSFNFKPRTSNLEFRRGQEWVTSTGYKFSFQPDGNLVMYNPQGKPTWATGTNGTGADLFTVQTDGNVVLYDRKKAVWATDTSGHPAAYFKIQGDGNLVVYSSNGLPLFDTATHSNRTGTLTASPDWFKKHTPVLKPGATNLNFLRGQEWITPTGYKFTFQPDGNLVLYGPQGNAIWATGTNGTGADLFTVQTDGNVVLYDRKKAVWATDTSGHPGAYFTIQLDGNVVVYSSNGLPLFDTATHGNRTGTLTASPDWLKKHTPPRDPGSGGGGKYYPDLASLTNEQWNQQTGDNTRFDYGWPDYRDERYLTLDSIEQIYTDLSNTIFGRRVPVTAGYLLDPGYRQGVGIWHSGIDMSTPIGEAVRVPVGGTIVRGIQEISGNYFIGVRADDGKLWLYGHLGSVAVPSGRIEAGQIIGRVGSAAHLHLEVQAGPNYRSSQSSNQDTVRNATLNPIKSFWELRNR